MGHKRTNGGPVPPGNRSNSGSKFSENDPKQPEKPEVASAQQQDPKHRIGDFEGKAQHSIQEPGGKNGADH